MIYQRLTIIVLLVLTLTSCASIRGLIYSYSPNINQGNCLTSSIIPKIHIGMTKKQVSVLLGMPIMSDPFGTKTWFYIFRHITLQKKINQKMLILTFNNDGILINIEKSVFKH